MNDAPGFRIRAAKPCDLLKLAPLEQRAGERFRDSAHPYAADLPSFVPGELAGLQRSGSVWVAVDERDEPVGFAIAGWLGSRSYLHERGSPAPTRAVGSFDVRGVEALLKERRNPPVSS